MGSGKVRWNFPYVKSNRNSTNTERELYEWDYRNRLTSVTQQEFNTETQEWTTVQIVEYTYDYNNVWIRKIIGNEKTIFIPENYQTVVQIDNGTVSHYYLWTPNQQDKLLADVTTEDILWALTDHLGSIRDVVGTTTNTHIIYDAYGNIISCKNSEGQTVDNPLLFAYTGKAFDTSTSLQNNINRWYAPTVGRWLSTDPIGFEGNDTNLYRYVKNQTLNQTDSRGLKLSSGATNSCEKRRFIQAFFFTWPCTYKHAKEFLQEADRVTESKFGKEQSKWGWQGDAFRHCYWSCIMTVSAGKTFSKTIADIHEECHPEDNFASHNMDYYNNIQGREIGAQSQTWKDCENRCFSEAQHGGRLQLIPGPNEKDTSLEILNNL